MKAATVRRLVNVSTSRQERVRRVVEYMDRVEGWGWKRRMEVRDHVMDQDHPTSWLAGRKLVSRVFLDKLEGYAARFGYVRERGESSAVSSSVVNTLDATFTA